MDPAASRPANHGMYLLFGVLLALMAAAAVVGAVVTEGSTFRIVGAGSAVVFGLCAYGFSRAARPPRLRGVDVHVDPERVRPGDSVDVAVRVSGRAPEDILAGFVGTVVITSGGFEGGAQRKRVLHEEWRPVVAGGESRMRFSVPDDAAASRHDPKTRIFWTVVVRRPARFRFDRRVERVVTVDERRRAG